MNNKLLAKSSGITLHDHSISVGINACKVLEKIYSDDIVKDKMEIVRISGLMHDIGKNTDVFQKKLKKHLTEEKNKFLHNEIGWAFLFEYLNVSNNVLDTIIDAVYWHHGIINKMGKHYSDDILKSISIKDIDYMKEMVVSLLGVEFLLEEPRSDDMDYKKKTPSYYTVDSLVNADNHIIRTCIICGDRLSSIMEDCNTSFDFEYNKRLLKDTKFKIDTYSGGLSERFLKQLNISETCGETTIVKAPAGFGKTLLGLMWNKDSDKKLIWVSPRNTITSSTYKGIIKELSQLGMDNVKVECFFSGEVKFKNYDDGIADIMVTNIDNFISPTVDAKNSDTAFLIDCSDVVFDEYHELLTESALYSSFTNIMRVRNLYTNSKTLLLSATPTMMNFLWDNKFNPKTKIMPSLTEHYPAIHTNRYKVKFVDTLKVNTENSLVIVNSIKHSQDQMDRYNCSDILHSKFTTDDINSKLDNLFITNGYNVEVKHTGNTIGTLIIQASLDISFNHLYEMVFSPEATIQRIGRCDRWGNLHDSTITFCRPSSMEELSVIKLLYDRNLCDMWYDFLQENIKYDVSLDEMYVLYNRFNEIHNKSIIKFIKSKNTSSLDLLSKIHPIKKFNGFNSFNNSDKVVLKANSNKFRVINNQLFYTCKIHGTNDFMDPMSETIRGDIGTMFKEDSRILNKMRVSMRNIRDSLDERFDYNDMLNLKDKLTIDDVRKAAFNSNTPYIRYDVEYHPKYGVVKIVW
jgi:CRISPR-associated endonuclease Cas3-HD